MRGVRSPLTRAAVIAIAALTLVAGSAATAHAEADDCHVICPPEWKVEPTFTIENLGQRHRVRIDDGTVERVSRERLFETVLALDLPTSLPRLGFTFEAITAPFSDDNDVELEFESNFHWLTASMTGGWVTSHFDVVDQLSPDERPGRNRAYLHKLDFELDTAVHPFVRLAEGRWLRKLEIETSLDYLASGLPRRGDDIDGELFLDDASPWSLSFVIVIPIAPF